MSSRDWASSFGEASKCLSYRRTGKLSLRANIACFNYPPAQLPQYNPAGYSHQWLKDKKNAVPLHGTATHSYSVEECTWTRATLFRHVWKIHIITASFYTEGRIVGKRSCIRSFYKWYQITVTALLLHGMAVSWAQHGYSLHNVYDPNKYQL